MNDSAVQNHVDDSRKDYNEGEEDETNVLEYGVVALERQSPSVPSPAVVFARQYAQNRGLQKIDYRKIVAQRALQRRGFESLLDMVIYQLHHEEFKQIEMQHQYQTREDNNHHQHQHHEFINSYPQTAEEKEPQQHVMIQVREKKLHNMRPNQDIIASDHSYSSEEEEDEDIPSSDTSDEYDVQRNILEQVPTTVDQRGGNYNEDFTQPKFIQRSTNQQTNDNNNLIR